MYRTFFIINPNSHSLFNGSVAQIFADLIKRNSNEAKEKNATSKNVRIVQSVFINSSETYPDADS